MKELILSLFLSFNTNASYYGPGLYGNNMANGQVLKQNTIAVAHKYLPLGTIIEVKNLKNNKTIVLEVADRGPYIEKRGLDLTYAAAKKLDMIQDGIIPVEVTIIKLG